MARPIPRQSALWDARRNTSAVFGVPPEALGEALDALAAFEHAEPALYAWIAEGAPRLTEAEHVQRFGQPFNGPKARRGSAEPVTARAEPDDQLDLYARR
jgi:hypothetical protein